jgi:hypothetical protein
MHLARWISVLESARYVSNRPQRRGELHLTFRLRPRRRKTHVKKRMKSVAQRSYELDFVTQFVLPTFLSSTGLCTFQRYLVSDQMAQG